MFTIPVDPIHNERFMKNPMAMFMHPVLIARDFARLEWGLNSWPAVWCEGIAATLSGKGFSLEQSLVRAQQEGLGPLGLLSMCSLLNLIKDPRAQSLAAFSAERLQGGDAWRELNMLTKKQLAAVVQDQLKQIGGGEILRPLIPEQRRPLFDRALFALGHQDPQQRDQAVKALFIIAYEKPRR